MRFTLITASLLAIGLFASAASAVPVSVDGVLGPEWTGASSVNVAYNGSAPIGNFSSPTNENSGGAYTIFTRGDANYFYVGLQSGANYNGSADFANLYFDTQHTGSTIGFEVTNTRAFIPGVSTGGPLNDGYYPYTSGSADIWNSVTAGGGVTPSVIEFAAPWSVFTSNSLNLNTLAVATSQVRLNLSQTFGLSVAGGQSFYGDTRLGEVSLPVPEPTGFGLLGLAVAFGSSLVRRCRG